MIDEAKPETGQKACVAQVRDAACDVALAALVWLQAREAERKHDGLAPTSVWQARRDAEAALIRAVRAIPQEATQMPSADETHRRLRGYAIQHGHLPAAPLRSTCSVCDRIWFTDEPEEHKAGCVAAPREAAPSSSPAEPIRVRCWCCKAGMVVAHDPQGVALAELLHLLDGHLDPSGTLHLPRRDVKRARVLVDTLRAEAKARA